MMDSDARHLGDLIANAREAKGISIHGLAAQTGYASAWLFKLEHGQMNQPDGGRLARLAEVLQIDPVLIDRVTDNHLRDSLSGMRVYFRSRDQLSPEGLDELEAAVERIRREYGTDPATNSDEELIGGRS